MSSNGDQVSASNGMVNIFEEVLSRRGVREQYTDILIDKVKETAKEHDKQHDGD